MGCKIIGLGTYLPENIVYNDQFVPAESYAPDMQEFFDGIEERRHASSRETSIYMGTEACRRALENAGVNANEIDLLITYSVFNDYEYPKDGNFIAANLGLQNSVTLHVDTACSSSLTMLKVASAMIETGMHKTVLIVAITNWVLRGIDRSKDYSSLGDAASAVLLTKSKENSLIAFKEEARPTLANVISMKAPCATRKMEYVEFGKTDESRDFFKVGSLDLAKELMHETKLFPKDIDWAILHQAGSKLLDIWYRSLEFSREKCLNSIRTFGNMSAANNFVNLEYFIRNNTIKRKDKILFFSPGAGVHNIALIWEF